MPLPPYSHKRKLITLYTISYYDQHLKTHRDAGLYQHPPHQLAIDFAKNPNVSHVKVKKVKQRPWMVDYAMDAPVDGYRKRQSRGLPGKLLRGY